VLTIHVLHSLKTTSAPSKSHRDGDHHQYTHTYALYSSFKLFALFLYVDLAKMGEAWSEPWTSGQLYGLCQHRSINMDKMPNDITIGCCFRSILFRRNHHTISRNFVI
jgi:hypothetical protein